MKTLVIGATGGIGLALARLLAGKAQRIYVSGRNSEKLLALAQELNATAIVADLSDENQVADMMTQVGELDLLIYAAGAVAKANIRQMDFSEWRRVLDANLTGVFFVLKYARFNKGARAVFIGAYPELIRVSGLSAYAVSKAGLEALLNIARKEMRSEGVNLILVRMPEVATPLWSVFGVVPRRALQPAEAAQKILDNIFLEPCPEVVEIERTKREV